MNSAYTQVLFKKDQEVKLTESLISIQLSEVLNKEKFLVVDHTQ